MEAAQQAVSRSKSIAKFDYATINRWRTAVQALCLFALNPFFFRYMGVCIPVMNCWSCPAAAFACPVGVAGNFLARGILPLAAIAITVFCGMIAGRVLCGWICPFGFLQDLMHKIPSPKIRLKGKWCRLLFILPLAFLALTVFLVPVVTGGVESPLFFCSFCPAGTLEAALPVHLAGGEMGFAEKTAVLPGSWRVWILVGFLALFVVMKRPFCRLMCPIGIATGFFNWIGLFQVKLADAEKCAECGECVNECPAGLDFFQSVNTKECLHCYVCSKSCPLRPHPIEKTAPCMSECPQRIDIRRALITVKLAEKRKASHEKAFREAWEIFVEKNPLPAVCGRVCPHPCETDCNRKEIEAPLSISAFERFIGDFALKRGLSLKKKSEYAYEDRIAVIGAGPAGLSYAYHLARRGYPVTIFEANEKPGGMLRYGIPAYRLPREVLDAEINRILKLGVELRCSTAVGRDISYDEVRKNYKAIFIGIGAHKGITLRMKGEDAANVMTGVEFLKRVNSGDTIDVGRKVVVIGGGDTAVDAARVARRMGAEASILYRRTRDEMPAISEEIEGAEEEGVHVRLLVAPVGFFKKGDRATKMVFRKCELAEPDASGRRRPVPIAGSEFEVEADFFISAISQAPDLRGMEKVDPPSDWAKANGMAETTDDTVFAGGDVASLGLVTTALAQGRTAAEAIHRKLRDIELAETKPVPPVIKHDKIRLDFYEDQKRTDSGQLDVDTRFENPDAEIVLALSEREAVEEAGRCMSCGSCFECGECLEACEDEAVIEPALPGEGYGFRHELCTGCRKCADRCPCGFIEMHMPDETPGISPIVSSIDGKTDL